MADPLPASSMPEARATVAFERSHHIDIAAPAAAVFDYVSNPRSWPEWIAASHHIDCEDRPLTAGETFREKWHTSREAILNWTVLTCEPPKLWVARADTTFIGPIVIRYTFEATGALTRYTRSVSNPARRKAPTAEMIEKMDEEAALALANIKANVERRLKTA